MTTLLDRAPGPRPEEKREGRHQSPFRIPIDRSRRRPLVAIVSALAVFTSIAAFAFLYRSADRRMPVLVVTRAVQQGQRFTTSDLGGTAVVPGPGVATVPLDRADTVLGRSASVTLTPGALLTPDDVSPGPPVPVGEAVVGVALKQGQMPAGGLSAGDHVMVVETASPGSAITSFLGPATSGSPPATGAGSSNEAIASSSGAAVNGTSSSPTGVLVPDSIVFETSVPGQQSSSDVSELVSLEVDVNLAPAVSAAAAAGQVSLAYLPPSQISSDARPPTPGNSGRGGVGRPRSSSSPRGSGAVPGAATDSHHAHAGDR